MMTPTRSLTLSLLLLSCLVGCAEADLPTSFEEPPVREVPTEEVDPPVPVDMGRADMVREDMAPDMLAPDDMAGDMANDMVADLPDQTIADMAPDMVTEVDMDRCGPTTCVENATECRTARTFVRCIRDVEGCLGFGPAETCPGSDMCSNDACQSPPQCIDADNDGYGENCAMGPDCDDGDRDRNSGRTEICDNKDNDCNNRVDDNISGVGDACSSGQGVCAMSGGLICDGAAQMLLCDASPGSPTTEICDMVDNDCDGQVDEGGVCPCGEDLREPNNSAAAASTVGLDMPTWNFICDTDQDYYTLPNNLIDGQEYAFILAYPAALSDLQLQIITNGTRGTITDLSGEDHAGIRFTYNSANTYQFEVIHNGSTETFYRVNLFIEDTDCKTIPDFFEHNDTIGTASLFVSDWRSRAYVCEDEDDWYYLGQLTAGTPLQIDTFFEAGFWDSGGDLDLELFGDPDGDGLYDVVASARGTGDDEFLSYNVATDGFYYLRVFAYSDESNSYEIIWTR